MSAMTTMKTWEDKYFETVKKFEQPVLRVTGRVAERVAAYVPARPAFMADVPTAAELVEFTIKLRKRQVETSAQFAKAMLKAVDPMVTKFENVPTVKPAAKNNPVAAAVKPTVTKARTATKKTAKNVRRMTPRPAATSAA